MCEFLGHPCTVHLTLDGVMEDVQTYGAPQELPHPPTLSNIVFRYQSPILISGCGRFGVACRRTKVNP
jgi:hypothetical protein